MNTHVRDNLLILKTSINNDGTLIGSAVGAGISSYLDRAKVYHNTTQTVANGTLTPLAFNAERFDAAGLHSTSVNTTRITAVKTGLYLMGGGWEMDANATGYRQIGLRTNGTSMLALSTTDAVAGGDVTQMSISTINMMTAGDYIELTAQQTSGGTRTINATDFYTPIFWAYLLTT